MEKNMETKISTTTPETAILSEHLIPAVKGEFYDYDYRFFSERPVFALLKCKSQKGRPIADLSDLGEEANILFSFVKNSQVIADSIQTLNDSKVFANKFDKDFFGETYIGYSDISADQFYSMRDHQDIDSLIFHCNNSCYKKSESLVLKEGDIFAAVTKSNKYGMFLIKEIMPSSILINACHILL